MKKTLSLALAASTALVLSGCVEVFRADGTCGSISGDIHPLLILENQDPGERSGALEEFFGGDFLIQNAITARYSFSADEVTNAFAVRSFQAPSEEFGFGVASALNAQDETVEYVSLYLIEDDRDEEEFVPFDTKPTVEAELTIDGPDLDLDNEPDFQAIKDVSVDYSPMGGLMPTIGLPGPWGPFESSFPFVLPVDIFTMCWESPEAGEAYLYGEGDSDGLLNNTDEVPFFESDGVIEDSSSLRTYPGFAGEDFVFELNEDNEYVISVLPTEIIGVDETTETFDVDFINLAIVPWFEAMGEPTGNPAEDSARATYIWITLAGMLLDEAESFEEAFFLSPLQNMEYSGAITLSDLSSSLSPENLREQLSQLLSDGDPEQSGIIEDLGPITNIFLQVSALETTDDHEFLRVKYAFLEVTQDAQDTELPPVPYYGPIVTNDPETATSGGTVTYLGSDLDEVTSATIAGQAATIVSKSPSALTLRVPTGLALGQHDVDLHYSTTEVLTLQNGLVIQDPMKVWTQLQTDNTVKMYAKNIIGEGKIQFFHNGNEIAWVRASNALNPKLREANGSHYLVRTRELVAGKNAFEIYDDGTRIWRAAYSG